MRVHRLCPVTRLVTRGNECCTLCVVCVALYWVLTTTVGRPPPRGPPQAVKAVFSGAV